MKSSLFFTSAIIATALNFNASASEKAVKVGVDLRYSESIFPILSDLSLIDLRKETRCKKDETSDEGFNGYVAGDLDPIIKPAFHFYCQSNTDETKTINWNELPPSSGKVSANGQSSVPAGQDRVVKDPTPKYDYQELLITGSTALEFYKKLYSKIKATQPQLPQANAIKGATIGIYRNSPQSSPYQVVLSVRHDYSPLSEVAAFEYLSYQGKTAFTIRNGDDTSETRGRFHPDASKSYIEYSGKASKGPDNTLKQEVRCKTAKPNAHEIVIKASGFSNDIESNGSGEVFIDGQSVLKSQVSVPDERCTIFEKYELEKALKREKNSSQKSALIKAVSLCQYICNLDDNALYYAQGKLGMLSDDFKTALSRAAAKPVPGKDSPESLSSEDETSAADAF